MKKLKNCTRFIIGKKGKDEKKYDKKTRNKTNKTKNLMNWTVSHQYLVIMLFEGKKKKKK